MSLVQKLRGNDKTFLQLTESALTHVLHEGSKCHRIDVVFDVYREMSIKDAERSNRTSDTGIRCKNTAPGNKIQQWRNFLCSHANNTAEIRFLVEQWKSPQQKEKLLENVLYASTCGIG